MLSNIDVIMINKGEYITMLENVTAVEAVRFCHKLARLNSYGIRYEKGPFDGDSTYQFYYSNEFPETIFELWFHRNY